MARRGFKGPKDPYEDLDSDYKDAIAASTVEDINKRIAEIAKNEQDNLKAKGDDQDLKEKKEAATEAGKQYKDASKQNRLRILFAMRVLGDKGKV
jgi:ElaB/YqjD/DUF883 family membrane-anchored ribosome-binding protein